MKQLFIDCSGSASDASVLQVTFTAPNGFAATIVLVDSAKHLIAFAAENELGEAVVTTVATLTAIGTGMHDSPAYQFFLHLHEDFLQHNTEERCRYS